LPGLASGRLRHGHQPRHRRRHVGLPRPHQLMADPVERRRLGSTSVEVTRLGLGCAPLGNLYEPITDDDATGAVDAAWAAGVRFFDTAPLYGHGLSELRLGAALAGHDRAAT